MPYSDIVLADRPLGYWSGPQVSRKNLLTDNQYSIETSTIGWTALDNTSISRVTTDAWVGNASIQIDPSSSSESGFKISSGSRIELSYGRTYTMVARVKNISGSRNARIRIEYFTTQNGSTLSEPVRLGQVFQVSSTDWTTIYHTETLPVGVSTNYFASWGVISETGLSTDLILCDGIQFFEGPLYSMYDEQYENDAKLRYLNYQQSKPIIFGGEYSVRLSKDAIIEIDNNYKLFINGSEDKPGSIDFWFTLETPPSSRHQLLKIGAFINVYLENDKVYIDYLGIRDFIQINDWSKQHYCNIVYSNKKIILHINDLSTTLDLGSDFQFDKMIDFIPTSIVIGPAGSTYNLISNPSFEEDLLTGWVSKNSSIQQITSDYFSGGTCLEITKQAVQNSGVSYGNRITLSPYKKYFISAYVKIPTGQPTSSISIKCNHYDSFSGSTIVSTDSQSVSITNNDWNRISLEISPTVENFYVEFEIIQEAAGSANSKFLVDAVLLEKSYSVSTWSETLNDSDPIFISDVALYSYDIGDEKRNNRISYATIDDKDTLAIEYGADIIELNYSNDRSVYDINALIIDNSANVVLDNLVIGETGLSMPSLSTEQISIGSDGGYATLNRNGIKFSGAAFLKLSQADPYFNPVSSTVRLQTVFNQSSGNGSLLFFGGAYDAYGLVLQKLSNKIRMIKIVDPLLDPEILFESSVISNGLINIALNFQNQMLSAKIASQTFTDIEIPIVTPGGGIFVGNIPETSNAYPDYIRNLAIDSLTDLSNIDWMATGRYMLRFIYDLNVSQRSEFLYTSSTPQTSSNSIVIFNTASQNEIYVNDSLVKEISYIPNFNYSVPEPVETRIVLESDNSASDRKTINNVYLSIYDSSNIVSSLSNFSLNHNILYPDTYDDIYVDIYGGEFKNPFIMNVIPSNVLSHDDNLGIKFNKISSTGARISCNSSSYELLEMVFKINMYPNKSESYTIFDLDGSTNINLLFTDQGLVKNGDYQLFIDGQLITNTSSIQINYGEMYHMVVKFTSSISNDIHIGCDKNMLNKFDGTIGKINVYTEAPTNLSVFAQDKYSDLIGRLTKRVEGASISITDESLSQEYVRDSLGEYFEMKNLPKVKIVSET